MGGVGRMGKENVLSLKNHLIINFGNNQQNRTEQHVYVVGGIKGTVCKWKNAVQ